MRKTFTAVVDHFRELYRYRVLVQSLVVREVKARYRGSALGFFWTLANPLLLLIVYRFVFTIFTRAVDKTNYSVFVFVGILPWLWLSGSITNGTTSIAQGGNLITRVCMPPQVLPAVAVLSNLVNFLFALPIAIVAAAAYRIYPSPALAFLPLVVLIELGFVYGLALLLATLTVRFRDIQFLVQNLMMVWFFLTPIAIPLAAVPEPYRTLMLVNPATPVLVPFQEILFDRSVPNPLYLALGAAWTLVVVIAAVHVFEARRGSLAEEI